ncbi:hypothetical protein FA743_07655 [Paracoccus gahaiensis]|uniref:Uncharacterized protein n=1 Tax=Paracoccus gahaiensis TaxID=1706839 RepID=A0A4U0RA83_9RHOB|nr:hypothetical protein [Paracoccus gahaiensis]TJZ92131.1 hypothetical protein FA743_07655 [Paracoccus gahaiensis]
MNEFSTCFPVGRPATQSNFIQLLISWLDGVKASKVLVEQSLTEIYDDDILLKSKDGAETLRIKNVNGAEHSALGMQHEILDNEGRIWRTECVLTHRDKAWAHIRGQCVIADVGAIFQRPKKPFLIKMMLKDGWASIDGDHIIDDKPHRITSDEVDLASRIISGMENGLLPKIYLSRDDDNQLGLNADKLAFDLGGLAHVFVEPDRSFSIDLMEVTNGKNPYGGTVGICLPGRGIIRKFYKRSDADHQASTTNSMIDFIVQYHASISRPYAMDWRALQEAQSRELRKGIEGKLRDIRASDGHEVDTYIAAFDAEMSTKDARILELENALSDALSADATQITSGIGIIPAELSSVIGRQLYDGEVSDRIRRALNFYICDEKINKSKREHHLIQRLLDASQFSGRSLGLVNEIKSACRDVNEMPKRMGAIFSRLGFARSEEGKHLKFTPPVEFGGIDVAVLPKTSSDHRAGLNQASDIIDSFSLKDLHKD